MYFLDQVKLVREDLSLSHEKNSDDSYIAHDIKDSMTGKILVSLKESKEILNYLERKGFIYIYTQKLKTFIGLWPEPKPVIDPASLDLMSKQLAEHYSKDRLLYLLKKLGVENKYINTEDNIHEILYKILIELSFSTNKEDKKLLFYIISSLIYPLNLEGDWTLSKKLKDQFQGYLEHDFLKFVASSKRGFCNIEREYSIKDDDFIENVLPQWQEAEYYKLNELKEEKNKERLVKTRACFKLFMNVVEVFCIDLKPTEKLNKTYQTLEGYIWSSIEKFQINNYEWITQLGSRKPPFKNLYSAEKDYSDENKALDWDMIRPEMNSIYSDIKELCEKVGVDDISVAPDFQEKLDHIDSYLSELKEKKQFERSKDNSIKTAKNIAPTESGELRKSKRENIIFTLPPGTKWGNITIRFWNEQQVEVAAKGERRSTDYAGLGFADQKTHLPNVLWVVLFKFAINGGELSVKEQKVTDDLKKTKQLLKDCLQDIFKITSDPFPFNKKTKKYESRIILIPPDEEAVPSVQDLLSLGIAESFKEQTPLIDDRR